MTNATFIIISNPITVLGESTCRFYDYEAHSYCQNFCFNHPTCCIPEETSKGQVRYFWEKSFVICKMLL